MQVTVNQTSTYYQKIGNHGDYLVLLHGWGHQFETFSSIIPGLSDHFQVIALDLPAFGRSANPQPINGKAWNSNDYVNWLSAFLEQVIPSQSFTLVGHSFGGKIAALFAANHQEQRLKHLILMDASGLPLPLKHKEQFVQSLAQVIPSTLKTYLARTATQKILRQFGIAQDYQQANAAQQAILRRIVREDISTVLGQITVPTDIIWGEHDETTPLSAGKRFTSLIPNAKLHLIAKSGHVPFHDQPQDTLRTILKILL